MVRFCIFIVFFGIFQYIQAQSSILNQVQWGSPTGDNFKLNTSIAADGNWWMALCVNGNSGPGIYSQVAKINAAGEVLESARFDQGDGAFQVIKFQEGADGARYAFILQDDSPQTGVFSNNQAFIAKFNANWSFAWARKIQPEGVALVAATFADIQVAPDGLIYFLYYNSRYVLNCMSAEGDLLWTESISTGLAPNGSSGSISSNFVLDAVQNTLIFQGFNNNAGGTQVIRLNRFTGAVLTGALFPGFRAYRIDKAGSSKYVLLGNSNLSINTKYVLVLKENLQREKGWQYDDPLFFAASLVSVSDSIGYIIGNSGGQISVLRFNFDNGAVGNWVRYPGLAFFQNEGRAQSAGGQEQVLLPCKLFPAASDQTAFLLLDSSLESDVCRPLPNCITITETTWPQQTSMPNGPSGSVVNGNGFGAWSNQAVFTQPYCSNNLALLGVFADFSCPDTICAGSVVEMSGLQNGGASVRQWTFPGGIPAQSDAANPGLIKFETPGGYTLRQIVVSECLQDTFERLVVVMPVPLISVPDDRVVCQDSSLEVTAGVQLATDWRWENGSTALNRTITADGTYVFSADNLGYCLVKDSFTLRFIRLDARFEAPVSTCFADTLQLQAAENPAGTTYQWSINPVANNLPFQSNTATVVWSDTGTFLIRLQVANSTCTENDTKVVQVLPSPRVQLGTDTRLKNNQQILLQPGIVPASAAFEWADAYPFLDRLVQNPGVYVLTARLGSCTATDSIVFYAPLKVYFPNAFRPDSDLNSYFGPSLGEDVLLRQLEVFDRWGSLLYRGQAQPGWDGRDATGQVVSSGVYVYRAILLLPEGNQIEYSGDITLLK